MSAPVLIDGWTDVQRDPACLRHARRCIAGVGAYHKDAASLVKYFGEFISLACAPDMLAMRLFPNGKEISESFGAFDAVRYRLPQFDLRDPGVTVVAVGDGRTPRTAATFALRSAWTCHSVDPELNGGIQRWAAIRRLTLHKARAEAVSIEADRVIVVAVHSHAKLPQAVAAVRAREVAVVAIPCCVPQHLAVPPDLEYAEKGIISPCRTVRVWRNVGGAR